MESTDESANELNLESETAETVENEGNGQKFNVKVVEILDERKRKGKTEYLVQWKGDIEEQTWEPETSFKDQKTDESFKIALKAFQQRSRKFSSNPISSDSLSLTSAKRRQNEEEETEKNQTENFSEETDRPRKRRKKRKETNNEEEMQEGGGEDKKRRSDLEGKSGYQVFGVEEILSNQKKGILPSGKLVLRLFNQSNSFTVESKYECSKRRPRTKAVSGGTDENQNVEGLGLWFLVKNGEDFDPIVAQETELLKFPNKGKYHLSFEIYSQEHKVVEMQTRINLSNVPENAKIHVDKNHLKGSNTDHLLLRTCDSYLTSIRYFLPLKAALLLGKEKKKSKHKATQKATDSNKMIDESSNTNSETADPILIDIVNENEVVDPISKEMPQKLENGSSPSTTLVPIRNVIQSELLKEENLTPTFPSPSLPDSQRSMDIDNSDKENLSLSQIHKNSALDLPQKVIRSSDLYIMREKLLGTGTFSKVYQGIYKNESVAVKIFNTNLKNINLTTLIRNEAILLNAVVHPNVVKFIGKTDDEPNHIVMELCDNNLYSILHDRDQRRRSVTGSSHPNTQTNSNEQDSFISRNRTNIAYQLAQGMKQIHAAGICHCDLSSMNVLLRNNRIKIADFGVSLQKEHTIAENLGTIRWRAPEMFIRTGKKKRSISDICTNKIDVFGYGVILWELFHTPHLPWEDEISDKDLESKVLKGLRPQISSSCPPRVKELIENCWQENPSQRMPFSEIVTYLQTHFSDNLISSQLSLSSSSQSVT